MLKKIDKAHHKSTLVHRSISEYRLFECIETPSSIDKSPSSGVHIQAAEAAETTPNLFWFDLLQVCM